MASEFQKPKAPFKFTNIIASQPEFLAQLEDFWGGSPALFHSTLALFIFCKNLKQLKPILRALSREKLADISLKASFSLEELQAKQISTLSNPSPLEVAAESSAFQHWERVSELEEGFLKQKSKLHWLHVGDKNNKTFYNAIKERTAKNSIHEICDPEGNSLTSMQDIKAEGVRYFSELLTHTPSEFTGIEINALRELLLIVVLQIQKSSSFRKSQKKR